MRKLTVLLLSICMIFILVACDSKTAPEKNSVPPTEDTSSTPSNEVIASTTDYPAAIMVNDAIYLYSFEPIFGEVDESAIIGYTTSYTDTFPEKNGETNFNRELDMAYAEVEDGIAVLYENEWHLCTPKDQPEENADRESEWGVTLSAKDVTPTGLTIVCTQSGGNPSGELDTGSYYIIQKYEDGEWSDVEWLPQEYDVGWTAEAWIIPMNDVVEWEVDWEWLYGELPAGKYRIGKEIMDFRGAGDFDQEFHYAEFNIAE